ncbi:MAG TPA: hypothetical protein VIS54_08935 [Psychromonas sp.]
MVNGLLSKNIELLICGAIPYYLEKILINQGCEVFACIAGEVDQVIDALDLNLLDTLKFKWLDVKNVKKEEITHYVTTLLNNNFLHSTAKKENQNARSKYKKRKLSSFFSSNWATNELHTKSSTRSLLRACHQ